MELVAWAEREARARLSRPLPRRWVHVQSVAAEASRIGTALGDEARVLVAAAVLHDVGYAPELVDTGFHPIDGARFLRRLGVDERVCTLVAHHSWRRGRLSCGASVGSWPTSRTSGALCVMRFGTATP